MNHVHASSTFFQKTKDKTALLIFIYLIYLFTLSHSRHRILEKFFFYFNFFFSVFFHRLEFVIQYYFRGLTPLRRLSFYANP